jgi:frataxin
VTIPNGKQWLISKHTPSRQIWLSSPISGGLHFSFDDNRWQIADGRELSSLLAAELAQLVQVTLLA